MGVDKMALNIEIPLKCREASALMMRHMDGALGEAGAKRLERHIASCESCKNDFETYKTIQDEFARLETVGETTLPAGAAPENFVSEVMAKIALLPERRRKALQAPDNIIYAVWGVFSILFGSGFLLFLNKDRLAGYMEGNAAFAAYLNFTKPITSFISNFISSLGTVASGAFGAAKNFISEYRFYMLAVLAALIIIQYFIRLRKPGQKAIEAKHDK